MARLTSSLKLQLRPLYQLKVNTMNQITQDYLREHFDYKDGQLMRKIQMGNYKAGTTAGSIRKSNGYVRTNINRREYYIHRLIYLYHYGVLHSDLEIDHINGIRADNRIENLRMVTRQHNQWNRKKDKGYCWDKYAKKFKAYIYKNNKTINLGNFTTEEDARNAYLEAKKIIHKF